MNTKAGIDSKNIEKLTNNDFEYCNIAYDLIRYQKERWLPYFNVYDLLVNNFYGLLHTIEVLEANYMDSD